MGAGGLDGGAGRGEKEHGLDEDSTVKVHVAQGDWGSRLRPSHAALSDDWVYSMVESELCNSIIYAEDQILAL